MTVKRPARRPRVIGSWHAWSLALALLNAASGHSPAASFVVTNTLDSGNGSLRQALLDANAMPGPDIITFQISGTGTCTISPRSALPSVSDPVEIDGTTQPGFAGQPLIELNGASAGSTSVGLRLASSNSVVRGLVINRFGGGGLRIEGVSSNLVQGNFIGTDATGTIAQPNGNNGITINDSSSNVIGGAEARAGNVISGNTNSGIHVIGAGATGNLIQGNYIGTDASGLQALGNSLAGISMNSVSGNVIGGTNAGVGNVISGNRQDGLYLTNSSGIVVQGNYIGVDVTGASALSNAFSGITIYGGTSNVVGGTASGARNLISGNKYYGLYLVGGSSGNLVQGNYIGADVTGRRAVANSLSGLRIDSGGNTIGGAADGAGNLISGNGDDGITLAGAAATGNLIAGNYLGTDASGTAAVANGEAGIGLCDAPANTIGGTTSGAGNLISGNNDAGIYLLGYGSTHNVIQGNTIGADITGMSALGNYNEGIYVQDGSANTIGGTTPGSGNQISANQSRGIWLTNASWNVIQGNWIGTKKDGNSPLGNTYHAVECEAGANNNLIGGPGIAGNRIAFSKIVYAGVRIRNGSTNNAILGNRIFSNGALGIDLGAYGVAANDLGDADSGANQLQNYPVLSQAVLLPGRVAGIRGTLNSRPNGTYLLQFFANQAGDRSGYGEGQIYLGDQTVVTGADDNASFLVYFTNAFRAGYMITATATDAANNTSEFSAGVPLLSMPALVSGNTFVYNNNTLAITNMLSFSWTNSATFVLKEATNLVAPVWVTSTDTPVLTSSNWWRLLLANPPRNKYYKLSFE